MKKVVVCMPLNEELQNSIFKGITKLSWMKDMQVDFVHMFKQESFPYVAPPTIYPDKDQMIEIQKTIIDIFKGLTQDLKLRNASYHVGFDESPKEGMVKYLKEHNVDFVVTYAKEKHGLAGYFSSSFTEYLVKHSPCNILVLR